MKEYFELQLKLFSRKIHSSGIHPIIGYLLIVIGFVGGSFLLFQKTDLAHYIIIAISLLILIPLSESRRNDFLKFHFTNKFVRVRMLENLIIVLPFVTTLLLNALYVPAALNIILALLLIFLNTGGGLSFVVPTPYFKTPFEFVTGFRRSFFFIVLAYALALIGILVSNFNIGAFSLIILLFVSISFYSEPENEYYVWIYSCNSKQFILNKIKTALMNVSILVLPILILQSAFLLENVFILAGFLLVVYVVLTTVIVAKYSAYPDKMSISQVVLLILSINFPPLLLAVIPYFYSRSKKRLNVYLK